MRGFVLSERERLSVFSTDGSTMTLTVGLACRFSIGSLTSALGAFAGGGVLSDEGGVSNAVGAFLTLSKEFCDSVVLDTLRCSFCGLS